MCNGSLFYTDTPVLKVVRARHSVGVQVSDVRWLFGAAPKTMVGRFFKSIRVGWIALKQH